MVADDGHAGKSKKMIKVIVDTEGYSGDGATGDRRKILIELWKTNNCCKLETDAATAENLHKRRI